ncbi:hypothetical protein Hanom_Chr10g00896861 [Helianthus anomalus]
MYVQEHAGNDKSCVWYVDDSVDDEHKDELFFRKRGCDEREWRKYIEL